MIKVADWIRVSFLLFVAFVGFWSAQGLAQNLAEPPTRSSVIAAGGKVMTAEQVRTMFLGNTIFYLSMVNWQGSVKGGVYAQFYRDAKTRVGPGGRGPRTEVFWWMEADAICNELPDGGRSCALIIELPGRTYSCNRDEDICRYSIRAVPGNPERF